MKRKKEMLQKNTIKPAINILQLGFETKKSIVKLEVGSEWEGRVGVINSNRLKSWWTPAPWCRLKCGRGMQIRLTCAWDGEKTYFLKVMSGCFLVFYLRILIILYHLFLELRKINLIRRGRSRPPLPPLNPSDGKSYEKEVVVKL